MITRRLAVVAVGAAAVVATVAGCSGGGSTAADPNPAVPSTSGTTTASAPTPSPTSSTPAAPTTTPRSTSAAPSPTARPSTRTSRPSTAHAAAAKSTCSDLGIRVIMGSAAPGREFAALQFTNNGTSACDLYGYPTVSLRRGGRSLGETSHPSTDATSHFRLGPGQTAESQLNDYTDCQAPLSDTIHVQAPGGEQVLTRPGVLRACTLRVGPLGTPQ